ncbi:MAG: TlpA family protein disulfide reductase [Flavobacteriales bacterium]
MNRMLFSIVAAALLLAACGQTEPVFNSELDVRDALARVESAQFQARMTSDVEASGSHWDRHIEMNWAAGALGDSIYGTLWTLRDAYISEGDTSVSWAHLFLSDLTSINSDSVLTEKEVDPDAYRNGNGIENYYAAMALPAMLTDTTWWAEQVSDSLVQVVWEHVLPTWSSAEQFILTKTDIQDTADVDFHPETNSSQRWVFEAPHGLPVRYEQSWYRGDMAYGSDLSIDWEWMAVNDESVENAILGWTAPEWAKSPEPAAGPEVAGGGGDEDWYETTLAALPQLEVKAPALEGQLLSGGPGSLADFEGSLVYLDFWYIGCGPCMRALPHLAHMQEEFGPAGFQVLGVNPYQDSATVQRYLDRRELDIQQLILDSLPEAYPVRAYPTWFLVGRDGTVLARDMGYGDDTAAFLDSLVSANL